MSFKNRDLASMTSVAALQRALWVTSVVFTVGMGMSATSLAADADGLVLEEIVVTAQKRAEGINTVPMSIQAFDGETLVNAGITDASGLAQLTPGLNFARSSANTPIYTLRGVGFNTPNLSSTSPVGVYVDEVAYAYPYMSNGPLFDIERVEVLKGPQGTLYGRNTTGGLVNFIVAKPGKEFEAGVSAELGNYKTTNFEGFVSVPLSDTFGVRFAARSETSGEGWQKSISRNERLGEKDRLGLRATAVWNATDALTIDLTGSYWHDKSDTIAAQAVRLIPDQPAFTNPGLPAAVRTDWKSDTADWDRYDGSKPAFRVNAEFYSAAARINYNISDNLSLVSLTAFNHVKRNDMNDVDGTAIEIFTQQSVGKIDSFSQELRLNGEAGKLSYIVGGYYSNDDITDSQVGYYDNSSVLQLLRFLAQNVIDPTNARYTAQQYATGFRSYRNTTDQNSKSVSAFATTDWKFNEQFKLTAGLRYSKDTLDFSACSGDFNGNTLPIWNTSVHFLVNVQSGAVPNFTVKPNGCMSYAADFTNLASFKRPKLNEDNVAGRLSAQFTPTEELLVYGTISRGFKSGSVPMLPTNVETQLEPAHQEQVTAYEVGTKATLFNRTMQANVSAFYYDYKDKQLFSEVLDPVFTTLTRIVNVPSSKVSGAELDLSWRATAALTLRGGASYTKTEVTKFNGFNRAGQATNFAGLAFPYTPTWQLNGTINYDQPISGSLGLLTSVNANYQSETAGSLGDEQGFEVASYTVVNANIGVHSLDDRWHASVYAKNLFDKYYWTATDVLTDTIFRVPGMARTYGLAMGWKFK